MLTGTGLACVRGERLLFRDVSFAVPAGGLLSVQGANGAGKTSLLRILVGLAPPWRGDIAWDGHPVARDRGRYARALHFLGHANGLKDDLDPVENLVVAARLAGDPAGREAASGALAALGVARSAALPARYLSHGQKRRVALARLVMCPRPLWVLDEPFAALDAGSVELLRDLLERHLHEGGVAVMTSHQDVTVNSTSPQVLRIEAAA